MSTLFRKTTMLGTPTYVAPEAFVNPAAVDGRSDLYSLGCMLYEMLAGEPPFTGKNAVAIMARDIPCGSKRAIKAPMRPTASTP